MSITVSKDPTDPRWRDDSGFKDWLAWMQTYNSSADIADAYNVLGYNAAMALTQVLKQCGDDLSRENIMRQAANLHGLTLPMLLPGITLNTGPHDYQPIKQMYLRRFNGQSWELLEEVTASISKE